MNLSDLEPKVIVNWETSEDGFSEECRGHVLFGTKCSLDRHAAFSMGMRDAKSHVEKQVRRELAHHILGELEAERVRLRVAVAKWGRRAMPASMSRQISPGDWTKELTEDLG